MKINTKYIFARLFIFLIFFVGFVLGGITLIIHGYNHDSDVELIFGLVIACLGLFQISQKYKISYVFTVIPVLVAVVGLSGTFIFILFYLPFFYKESLNLDLGSLILKDWFVRLVIIIIDVLLLINVFTYTKKQLSKNKEQEKGQY
ncbi:hypothetical protein [Chryseobacterium lathyri]|uniref:hypothetical protein n=1 Tax=Chryseobacterium lathyri TaxID=395933 RepID=UPI002782B6F5|nr:hypothetical protein [Chryseobacterium lathyri]MDQ0065920.1 magnesium-transporting ATPase (P-type) [Chryseobacterium lathyri]